MAISVYFGLPGCGKTTLMVYHALQAVKNKKYENVYCNVDISVPGVTYITNECIGKYDLSDGLILIDEATLFADSREFKTFGKQKVEYFLLHRHFNVDINCYLQQWDALDRKIRTITDRVYYVNKGFWTGGFLTNYYRIPYGIIIPDPNKSGEKLGEIIQGYAKPNIFVRIFCTKRLFRPKYYKYFDSWQKPYRAPLPDEYVVYTNSELEQKLLNVKNHREHNKRIILLRWKSAVLRPFRFLKNKFLSLCNQVPDPSHPIAE